MIDNKDIRIGSKVYSFIKVLGNKLNNCCKIGYKIGEILDRGDKWLKVEIKTHYIISGKENKKYIENWYVDDSGDIIYENWLDEYETLTDSLKEDELIKECSKSIAGEGMEDAEYRYRKSDLNFLLGVKCVVDKLIEENIKKSNVR